MGIEETVIIVLLAMFALVYLTISQVRVKALQDAVDRYSVSSELLESIKCKIFIEDFEMYSIEELTNMKNDINERIRKNEISAYANFLLRKRDLIQSQLYLVRQEAQLHNLISMKQHQL